MGEEVKIDVKDLRILSLLVNNARITNSEIGKKVNLSKKGVEYRINKLENQKIIKGYKPLINYKSLIQNSINAYVTLQYINPELKSQIEKELKKSDLINKAYWSRKEYDLIIYFFSDTKEKIKISFYKFKEKFDRFLKKIKIAYPLLIEYYNLDLAEIKKSNIELDSKFIEEGQDYNLKKIDRNILDCLVVNARLNSSEISRKIGYNYKTINFRLKELKEKKILLKTKAIIDFNKIGFNQYILFLETITNNNVIISKIISKISKRGIIIRKMEEIGDYNLNIQILTISNQNFYEIIDDLQEEFSDFIRGYQYVTITETITENPFF